MVSPQPHFFHKPCYFQNAHGVLQLKAGTKTLLTISRKGKTIQVKLKGELCTYKIHFKKAFWTLKLIESCQSEDLRYR